jgi:hypothetical protein
MDWESERGHFNILPTIKAGNQRFALNTFNASIEMYVFYKQTPRNQIGLQVKYKLVQWCGLTFVAI